MICRKCDGWIINTHNWDDDQKCDCKMMPYQY
jgi:hypothetical protein